MYPEFQIVEQISAEFLMPATQSQLQQHLLIARLETVLKKGRRR
jgi:hypothetical protein